MKERVGFIECGRCGNTRRIKYDINLFTIQEAEERLAKEACSDCGCSDNEELEKYVIDLDNNKGKPNFLKR